MTTALVLSVIGASLSAVSAIWMLHYVTSKIRAENRLKTKLRSQTRIKRHCAEKNILEKLSKDPPDSRTLDAAEKLIMSMLKDSSESDRNLITESLRCKTDRGLADYMTKILVEIGHAK